MSTWWSLWNTRNAATPYQVNLDDLVRGSDLSFRFAPKFHVLSDGDGAVSVRFSDAGGTPNVNLATVRSNSVLQSAATSKPSPSSVAKDVLNHLRENFLPLADYHYRDGNPSHRWSTEEAKETFIKNVEMLCEECTNHLLPSPMLLQCNDSPTYVFGDLHGNYHDLMLFEKFFWPVGFPLCPAKAIFLGDYVDRGPHSLETLAYLLASKILAPGCVLLLRGNHELRSVNGDVKSYKKGSFLSQCKALSPKRGAKVWEAANRCFDQMPVAAIIDGKILCVHGGVPRAVAAEGKFDFVAAVNAIPKGTKECDDNLLLADLLWADPSPDEALLPEESDKKRFPLGFGPNDRGGNTCVFDDRVLDLLQQKTGITHLIRAHQHQDIGFKFEKRAKVLTVFSSSHYQGDHNSAAAVLVANHELKVVVTKTERTTYLSPPSTKKKRSRMSEETFVPTSPTDAALAEEKEKKNEKEEEKEKEKKAVRKLRPAPRSPSLRTSEKSPSRKRAADDESEESATNQRPKKEKKDKNCD